MARSAPLLVGLAVSLLAPSVMAKDEILVVLPTRSEILEFDERHDLSDKMRDRAVTMSEELEMDILTTREVDRALRRWAGDPDCRSLKCDLKAANDIGAEIVVVSEVTETRGELLKLSIEVIDLRKKKKGKKGADTASTKNGATKLKPLASGDAKMRTFRKLLKQAGLGAETVLADAFLVAEEDKRDDRRGRGRRGGRGRR